LNRFKTTTTREQARAPGAGVTAKKATAISAFQSTGPQRFPTTKFSCGQCLPVNFANLLAGIEVLHSD
jgi:hypothetical protein